MKAVAKLTLEIILFDDNETQADLEIKCISPRDDIRQYEKRLASALMKHARNVCKPEKSE